MTVRVFARLAPVLQPLPHLLVMTSFVIYLQRYALATASLPTGQLLPTRYVVANPSSLAYLNSSRWVDIAAHGGSPTTLAPPPPELCPDYNQVPVALLPLPLLQLLPVISALTTV